MRDEPGFLAIAIALGGEAHDAGKQLGGRSPPINGLPVGLGGGDPAHLARIASLPSIKIGVLTRSRASARREIPVRESLLRLSTLIVCHLLAEVPAFFGRGGGSFWQWDLCHRVGRGNLCHRVGRGA